MTPEECIASFQGHSRGSPKPPCALAHPLETRLLSISWYFACWSPSAEAGCGSQVSLSSGHRMSSFVSLGFGLRWAL